MIQKFKSKDLTENWVFSNSVFEKPLRYGSQLQLYIADGDEETDDTGWVDVSRKHFGIFTGCVDKNGNEIYTNDKVVYNNKAYTIKFFPEYGCYGMHDEVKDRPLGRSGSSTKYEPYFMNPYHTKKMELLNK